MKETKEAGKGISGGAGEGKMLKEMDEVKGKNRMTEKQFTREKSH